MGKENGKKGVDKAIKSPADLWGYFVKYVESVKKDPFLVHDYVGKEAVSVHREKEKPLSMAGFERFVYESHDIDFLGVDQYFSNRDDRYTDFVGICSRVKKYIKADQIEGGAAGIYNASITQRLNGLHEHVKTEDVKPKAVKVTVVTKKDEK